MWLTVWTRLDLAERTSRLGQFSHSPTSEHYSNVWTVFAYLAGTKEMGLSFGGESLASLEVHSLNFHGYSNVGYADHLMDCKSTSGYLFKLAYGLVSWKSRKQPLIAMSSMKAEYVAYPLTCKEVIWLRQLLQELCYSSSDVLVILYGDNQLAIVLTLNLKHHAWKKHIDIQWHYI